MTPDQEAKANDAANRILAELDAAKTAQECADISEKQSAKAIYDYPQRGYIFDRSLL